MKPWFRYFLYASLLFLVVALYRADYLVIPRIYSIPALAGALVLLVLGFLADAISWKTVLGRGNYAISAREAVVAVGLSAFAKYIPGKIWALMGRAAYVAEKRSYPMGKLTSLSLTWQLIVLWVGLIFGAVGLLRLDALLLWGWPILLMWLGLTTVIFSNAAHALAQGIYKRIFGKEIAIPRLSFKSTLAALPPFVALWVLWMASFHLLVMSLSPSAVPSAVGLGFPLTITLGVLAAFAPGGLGVREGVMVGYLTLAGIAVPEATAIAVAARLWFFAGEALTFVVGLVVQRVPAGRG